MVDAYCAAAVVVVVVVLLVENELSVLLALLGFATGVSRRSADDCWPVCVVCSAVCRRRPPGQPNKRYVFLGPAFLFLNLSGSAVTIGRCPSPRRCTLGLFVRLNPIGLIG